RDFGFEAYRAYQKAAEKIIHQIPEGVVPRDICHGSSFRKVSGSAPVLSLSGDRGRDFKSTIARMASESTTASRCPACGAEFECGMLAGREHCWCEDLPALSEPEPGAPCYCPRCLEARVRSARGPRSARAP